MGLDGVELIMVIEEEFDISIPDAEAELGVTLNLLVDIVMAKVAPSYFLRSAATMPDGDARRQLVTEIVREIISVQLNVPKAEILPHSHLIKDLRMDQMC